MNNLILSKNRNWIMLSYWYCPHYLNIIHPYSIIFFKGKVKSYLCRTNNTENEGRGGGVISVALTAIIRECSLKIMFGSFLLVFLPFSHLCSKYLQNVFHFLLHSGSKSLTIFSANKLKGNFFVCKCYRRF